MKTLKEIATLALQKSSDDIDKALPHFLRAVKTANLIDEMAREYLSQFVGRESGQTREPHLSGADLTPPLVGSVKVKEHDVRQHRRRTHAEKQAAEQAMLASADAVFEMQVNGRAIGSIALGELHALKQDLIASASQGLMLHTIEVRDAIVAELIEQHCQVDDQLIRVREAVSAAQLNSFVSQAEQEAPRRIAEAMRHAAAAMEQRKEIAA